MKKSLPTERFFFALTFVNMPVIDSLLKFTFLFISLLSTNVIAQSCNFASRAFQGGESLSFSVHYNWGVLWVEAGSATFTVSSEKISSLSVYHFKGVGSTYPKYDWFYKVNDTFQAYADSSELKPFRYIRNSSEGGNRVYNDNYFDYRRKLATCSSIDKKNKVSKDTCRITMCTKDVLTMIYYARCIDYSKSKPGDKIPVSLYLDGKVYSQYIKYTGKERITTDIGTFDCIRISPLLISGTIFKEGDEMNVWVTDDQNRIPVYIETPIVVGAVKVKINSVTGNRFPLVYAK